MKVKLEEKMREIKDKDDLIESILLQFSLLNFSLNEAIVLLDYIKEILPRYTKIKKD